MGHDITAEYKGSEVAYLRRNMHSETIHTLYLVLNCRDCDGGVSGNGRSKFISLKQLKYALDWATDEALDADDSEDYIEFIQTCIAFISSNKLKGISIHFS